MFNVASHCYIEYVSPVVSDEVWHQLHPGAGRLSRRAAVRAWTAVVLAFVLVITGEALWLSGAVVPQVSWSLWSVKVTDPVSDVVGVDVEITNEGWASLTIAGVGRSGPGLDLVRTDGRFPVRVRPAHGVRVVLYYRVTDCGRAPVDTSPVAVRVRRSRGVQVVNPRAFIPPEEFPWDRRVTGPWCHPPR
jgi:hypothetical protein